jgi:hypothetical protein
MDRQPPIVIEPYDPTWPAKFAVEKAELAPAAIVAGERRHRVYHDEPGTEHGRG